MERNASWVFPLSRELMSSRLTGKTAVITGAGGVLCSVFAEALAAAGASVALLDINLDAAEAAADEIKGSGGRAAAFKCDVLDPESLAQVRAAVAEVFGQCDILINGAGGNSPRATTDDEMYNAKAPEGIKTFFDLDPGGINFVFNLNFMGTFLTTQAFARDMEGRDSCIINISSMNAFTPLTKIPAYSAAKAAVSNFTQWLAVYFAPSGIRCNAIAPGFFVTNQNRALLFDASGNPSARAEKILRNTPAGRFGEPWELVGTLMFLADSSVSGFVNGTVIPVDGGFSAYSGV